MGDPAAISPELTAKVISLSEVLAAARLMVIGGQLCRMLPQLAQDARACHQMPWNVE
jgi:hypothetical protein